MAGQFKIKSNNITNWTLTPFNSLNLRDVGDSGNSYYNSSSVSIGVKPSLNLKSNVIITGGDGTKNNPFTLELAN